MKLVLIFLFALPTIASAEPWRASIEAGGGLDVVSRQSFYTHYNGGALASVFAERPLSARLHALVGATTLLAYDEGCLQDECGPKLSSTIAAVLGGRYRFDEMSAQLAVGPASYNVWNTSQRSNTGAMILFTLGRRLSNGFEAELQTSLTLLDAASPMVDGNHANRVLHVSLGMGYRFE